MSRENIKAEIGNLDIIPLNKRAAFHISLMKYMIGENKPLDISDEEWQARKVKWALTYGKRISNILDNKELDQLEKEESKKIRNLILEEKYEEALKIIVNMLKTTDNTLK